MGDSADFEAILRDTQSVIRAYIAGMGVPLDSIDDLAQEVYLEFYKGTERRPAEVEPIRWLKGIARNLSLNYFRRSKRKAEQHLEAVAVLLERLACPLEDVAEAETLDRCLEQLPPRSRELIALRYEADLESAAIGRRLQISPEAVRITLLRIRTVLRDCLGRRLAQEGGG
ncbi:MAG TPA: sigma-70 family RNA polymerase sigma factor [Planctomycetota bacterium]|nr:sigma-70 family RNA polymerase sigma factor [Planctomycetota bacterium]